MHARVGANLPHHRHSYVRSDYSRRTILTLRVSRHTIAEGDYRDRPRGQGRGGAAATPTRLGNGASLQNDPGGSGLGLHDVGILRGEAPHIQPP